MIVCRPKWLCAHQHPVVFWATHSHFGRHTIIEVPKHTVIVFVGTHSLKLCAHSLPIVRTYGHCSYGLTQRNEGVLRGAPSVWFDVRLFYFCFVRHFFRPAYSQVLQAMPSGRHVFFCFGFTGYSFGSSFFNADRRAIVPRSGTHSSLSSPMFATSALKSEHANPILPSPFDTEASRMYATSPSTTMSTPLLPTSQFPLSPASPFQTSKFTPNKPESHFVRTDSTPSASQRTHSQSHSRGSSLDSELSSDDSCCGIDENPESFGSNVSSDRRPVLGIGRAGSDSHHDVSSSSSPLCGVSTSSPVDVDLDSSHMPPLRAGGTSSRLDLSMSLDEPSSFSTHHHMNTSGSLLSGSCRSEALFNSMSFGEHGHHHDDSEMMTDDFSNRAIF